MIRSSTFRKFTTLSSRSTIFLQAQAVLFYLFSTVGYCAAGLPVQLASVYDNEMDVNEFLVSEKYDGIRAIWKDGKLQSRNGNTLHAPAWFLAGLPEVWLDGELWSRRQNFEFVASTVSKQKPIDSQWKKIHYMIFDAPNTTQNFHQRATFYTQLVNDLDLDHVKPVKQFQISSNAALSSLLAKYTKAGAEGLMLHRAQAMFTDGRSHNILKLKPYMDAEAIVLEYRPGKGKYKGLMGAIKVRWQKGRNETVEFKIGTGFSDEDRANPPPIGSIITFKYHGFTSNKIPRFASFLRRRKLE